MDKDEADELFNAAREQWERGDDDAFYESAANLNEWLQDNDEGPLLPEDWYPEDELMQEAMWEWIDTLSHDEREAFFGY